MKTINKTFKITNGNNFKGGSNILILFPNNKICHYEYWNVNAFPYLNFSNVGHISCFFVVWLIPYYWGRIKLTKLTHYSIKLFKTNLIIPYSSDFIIDFDLIRFKNKFTSYNYVKILTWTQNSILNQFKTLVSKSTR